jgi:nucleoside-diphosphate-sugar epimerase
MRPDASEVLALQADPTLASELLGWSATTDLETGIAATIEWLRAQPAPAREASVVQL